MALMDQQVRSSGGKEWASTLLGVSMLLCEIGIT
jgi:hypothetical protein